MSLHTHTTGRTRVENPGCARKWGPSGRSLAHFGRAVHLSLCIFASICACQGDSSEITATQRTLGEINSDELDLTANFAPGLLRDVREVSATITGRASAGIGSLTIRTGPNSPPSILLDLRNVHPEAQLVARRARTITSAETLGDRCASMQQVFDINCTTSEDARCPSTSTSRSRATRATFTVPTSPCTEITYDLKIAGEQANAPVSFVVVGSLAQSEDLGRIHDAEVADGHRHDFYMVLGDAIEKKGNAFVSDLEDQIDEMESVAVVTPGDQEIGDDRGQYYERRFGAFEYRWTLKDVQFISFYSAQQTLDTRAIGSLRSALRAMLVEDQQWRVTNDYELPDGQTRALPAFAMTHTPLFDPSGPRNAGLKSRLEAGQAASLLANADVHTLFAGHIRDNAHVTDSSPNLVLTTSQPTRSNQDLAIYRRVTVSREPIPGSTPVGAFFLRIETLPLP